MPWSETSPTDRKTQFIADYLRGTLSTTELCDSYGISRKTHADESRDGAPDHHANHGSGG